MAYGRTPYYIFSDGENMNFAGQDMVKIATIPMEAIAQFLVNAIERGSGPGGIADILEQAQEEHHNEIMYQVDHPDELYNFLCRIDELKTKEETIESEMGE